MPGVAPFNSICKEPEPVAAALKLLHVRIAGLLPGAMTDGPPFNVMCPTVPEPRSTPPGSNWTALCGCGPFTVRVPAESRVEPLKLLVPPNTRVPSPCLTTFTPRTAALIRRSGSAAPLATAKTNGLTDKARLPSIVAVKPDGLAVMGKPVWKYPRPVWTAPPLNVTGPKSSI